MANAAQAQAKQLLPNQHLPLHMLYGVSDCCLCTAQFQLNEAQEQIARLELELLELKSKTIIPRGGLRNLVAPKEPRNRRERRRGASEDYGIVRFGLPCEPPPDDPPSE